MNMVIVTLCCTWEGKEKNYDMEIPCNVPIGILVQHICRIMKNYTEGKIRPSPENMHLFSRRLNRMLNVNETFDQVGIWNGDYIDMR